MILNYDDIFLFQGDSITDGNRGRNNDPNHILGHGFACMIAARLGADNYMRQPVFINRGQSGDNIARMYARWREDAILLNPTIINILIGINDSCHSHPFDKDGKGVPEEQYERMYRMLIQDTLDALPDVKLILCEPFFLCPNTQDEVKRRHFEQVKTEVKHYQKVVRHLSQEYGCLFVPFQDMFDELVKHTKQEYLVWDGLHPTMIGHEFMTRRWIETVEAEIACVQAEREKM